MTTAAAGTTGSDVRSANLAAYAALALMIVIWAVNFSVAKMALGVLSPPALNALRFPFAALVVWLALRVRGPIPLPRRSDVLRILLLAVIGNVIYQQFFVFGLDHTRAGVAAVLLAGTPILTAALSQLAGHEQVGPRLWIGAFATFFGIVLVVSAGPAPEVVATGEPSRRAVGELLMIGASFAWAVYTVGSRSLIGRYGVLPVTAWTLWIGTAGLVLIGLPDVLRTDFSVVTAGIWLAIVYAGALSIGVAYLIWYSGVRQIGNARTGIFSNLTPAVALLVAWLWLAEVPAAGQLAGAAVIIGGVTLAQRRPSLRGPARP
jgi:drug/metabolite transporter (DMT)-like permease